MGNASAIYNRIPAGFVLCLVACTTWAQSADSTGRPPVEKLTRPSLVRPASTVWLPVTSLLIPGFGQLAQGRYVSGFSHAAAATSGLVLFAESGGGGGTLEDALFDRDGARRSLYGLGVLYQGAGFLSAWDVFQASVPTLQQEQSRFLFLGERREYFTDLAFAPFRGEHLMKLSTWVPLGIFAGLMTYVLPEYRREEERKDPDLSWQGYTASDAAFTGIVSLNAGVTEEALFRGYMYPLFHQWSGENVWISNPAQAVLFALAHYGDVKVPVIQGAMGWYLGWMTRRNDWKLGQAICLHFWWDIIAISATMLTRSQVPATAGISLPVNW